MTAFQYFSLSFSDVGETHQAVRRNRLSLTCCSLLFSQADVRAQSFLSAPSYYTDRAFLSLKLTVNAGNGRAGTTATTGKEDVHVH